MCEAPAIQVPSFFPLSRLTRFFFLGECVCVCVCACVFGLSRHHSSQLSDILLYSKAKHISYRHTPTHAPTNTRTTRKTVGT
jgi:hypothetical protein